MAAQTKKTDKAGVVTLDMTLGLLELAVDLNRDDWRYRHVWAFSLIFYLLGVSIATRRYK